MSRMIRFNPTQFAQYAGCEVLHIQDALIEILHDHIQDKGRVHLCLGMIATPLKFDIYIGAALQVLNTFLQPSLCKIPPGICIIVTKFTTTDVVLTFCNDAEEWVNEFTTLSSQCSDVRGTCNTF